MQCPIFMGKHRLTILGGVLGAVGGFLYWKFVGCASGTCPITSSPVLSTLWGILMGAALLNIFEKKPGSKKSGEGSEK